MLHVHVVVQTSFANLPFIMSLDLELVRGLWHLCCLLLWSARLELQGTLVQPKNVKNVSSAICPSTESST